MAPKGTKIKVKVTLKAPASAKVKATAKKAAASKVPTKVESKKDSDPIAVRVPPRLKDWLAGKSPWNSGLTQAVNEWSQAMKNKGHEAVHQVMEAKRSASIEEKQALVSTLH